MYRGSGHQPGAVNKVCTVRTPDVLSEPPTCCPNLRHGGRAESPGLGSRGSGLCSGGPDINWVLWTRCGLS